jgi:ribosome biogenesis GTPase
VKASGRATLTRREPSTTVEGLVVRTESGFHRVLVDDHVVVCRAPKRILRGDRVATTAVVIGDHVRARQVDDSTGVIEEILPRRNELVRGAAGGSRFLDVIAANLDTLFAVHSLREPEFNGARLDRFLLIAEASEIPATIILNKLDLVALQEAEAIAAPYRAAGYPVILTCATRDRGIEELRAALAGTISGLVGPSGVGKSTLLNHLQPGLHLRTGEISDSTGKGRHTTTTAELLPLEVGGWVADTPGLRELAIREVAPEDVDWLFPEFRQYIPQCRFSDCTHREEIDCAVREALQAGDISPERYRSYRRVYDEVVEATSY